MIFCQYWWKVIDGLLRPIFVLAVGIDILLPFPPSNWVLMAHKPERALSLRS